MSSLRLSFLACWLLAVPLFAADPTPEAIKKLEIDLTGAKMKGQFTVTGKMRDGKLSDEEYTIESAKKRIGYFSTSIVTGGDSVPMNFLSIMTPSRVAIHGDDTGAAETKIVLQRDFGAFDLPLLGLAA